MSAELCRVSEPHGNNASHQATTVGGSKPLHRFMKGQPKIVGVIVLILGSSFFVISIAITPDDSYQIIHILIPPGILLGTLFIICGILYILTEHNPTKKTVTISLALSIVTILGAFWTILHIVPTITHRHYYTSHHYEIIEDNFTDPFVDPYFTPFEDMALTLEQIFLFYAVVAAVIFIVMSCLAGAALRSTKSQAIIVMTTTATETPVE